jgi:hypothetical protein
MLHISNKPQLFCLIFTLSYRCISIKGYSDLEMFQGSNLETNVLKIGDMNYKLEGNLNIQLEPNSFTYKK